MAPSKKEKKEKRRFRLLTVNGVKPDKPRYYRGHAPKEAAIRAFRVWSRSRGDEISAVFSIRQSKRGSPRRVFTYEGTKMLRDEPVEFVRKTKPKNKNDPVIEKNIVILHKYNVEPLYAVSQGE